MESIRSILKAHPFFQEFPPPVVQRLVKFATTVRFTPGQKIFTVGENADAFYLICQGLVAVEVEIPNYGKVALQKIRDGEILGWSWLFPPHRWHFDARALEETEAVVLDARTLRTHIEVDHELGYHLVKRIARVMEERLRAAREKLVEFSRLFPAPDDSRPEWLRLFD
ncbi:MAG: cyclic nucleotide-binding domain-containing protein [Calditrichaeota bacterium]|nr:MAG: cyclic nucleotide-binding domain-containing protein [Calditrichota bacterium]